MLKQLTSVEGCICCKKARVGWAELDELKLVTSVSYPDGTARSDIDLAKMLGLSVCPECMLLLLLSHQSWEAQHFPTPHQQMNPLQNGREFAAACTTGSAETTNAVSFVIDGLGAQELPC